MTVQAAIEEELPFLRSEALARMTSRVRIYRRTGKTTQDEDTGAQTGTWTLIHDLIPFRLAGTYRGYTPSRAVELGGLNFQVSIRTGHLPHDLRNLADNDIIHIVTGEYAGFWFRVIESDPQEQATARRIPLIGTEPPEELVS